MNGWKLAGCAAAGVVGIVALPVFGTVGAITAVGALVGASVGAGVGAISSSLLPDHADAEALAAAELRGEKRAGAEAAVAHAKLRAQYDSVCAALDEYNAQVDLMRALFGLGMASAMYAGEDPKAAARNLREFIAGLLHQALPTSVARSIEELAVNPPNLPSAWARADKVAPHAMHLFDQVVAMYATTDDGPRCKALQAAWAQLRAA